MMFGSKTPSFCKPNGQLSAYSFQHSLNRQVSCFEKPRVQRFRDIQCKMTVSTSGEIDCGPMHWMCILVEPVNAGGVDSMHSGTSGFKFSFCGRSRRFPKEFCEIFVFVFLREVVDEVPETIAMSRAWEPGPNALQKTLLTIRKEGNCKHSRTSNQSCFNTCHIPPTCLYKTRDPFYRVINHQTCSRNVPQSY